MDTGISRWETGETMADDHIAAVRRGFAAALSGDLDTLADLLDPDVVWHGGNPDDGCRGREEVLAFMRRAARQGRGPQAGHPALVDVIAAGDRMVVLIAPDGDPESELRANLTTFQDGRVVEILAQESPEAALAAVGLGTAGLRPARR